MFAFFDGKLCDFEMRNGRSDDRERIGTVNCRRNIGEGFRIIFFSDTFCFRRIRVENSGKFNASNFLPQLRMNLPEMTEAEEGNSEKHFFLRGLMRESPSIQAKFFSLFVTRE